MNGKRKAFGQWNLYILKCADGTFYTGITNDLERRVEQHNSGKASRYTRSRLPVELLYKEGCKNQSSALKKECRVKDLTRKEKEAYIQRNRTTRLVSRKAAEGAQRKP